MALWSVVHSSFLARVLQVVACRCGSKGDLEVTIQRCRTWITWWWSCGLKSKDMVPLICVCTYIWVVCICLITVSSPCLFMIGDDRVIR